MQPFVRLSISFITGMAGASIVCAHFSFETFWIITACVLLFLLSVIARHMHHNVFSALVHIWAFTFGATLFTISYKQISDGINDIKVTNNESVPYHAEGVLTERPIEKAQTWALEIRQRGNSKIILYVKKEKDISQNIIKDGCITNTINEDFTYLDIGDSIYADFRHLTLTNSNIQDTTYRAHHEYLFNHGVCATAYVPSNCWLVKKRSDNEQTILNTLKEIQYSIHETYMKNGIEGEAGALIEAMTIGKRNELAKETKNNFRAAGVSHILALSGYHITILVLILQIVLTKRLFVYKWRWICNIATVLLLWVYAAIAGFTPSLVRAVTMFTIIILCDIIQRETLSLNSCAIAAILILCYDPLSIKDVGFQLSFISLISIVTIGKRIMSAFTIKYTLMQSIWNTAVISFTCTIATAPMVAYHFGTIATYSILSNLLIAPFVFIVMYGSVMWWLSLCIENIIGTDSITSTFTTCITWAADSMHAIVSWTASLPFSTIEWHPSSITVTLCYATMLVLYGVWVHSPSAKISKDSSIA